MVIVRHQLVRVRTVPGLPRAEVKIPHIISYLVIHNNSDNAQDQAVFEGEQEEVVQECAPGQ
jgi:hypothetical protein